jgi:hypothetical protein
LGLALLPTSTVAQQKTLKEQLVGTWAFVSGSTKRPDGTSQCGSNPKGVAIFTENGRFSELIMRSDRPKFMANNRLQGTPDDNKATAQGTVSSFGTYSVDEQAHIVTHHRKGNINPGQVGDDIVRAYVFESNDRLVLTPAGSTNKIVWERPR